MNVTFIIYSCDCVLSPVLFFGWDKTNQEQILTSRSYCLLEVAEKYRFILLVIIIVVVNTYITLIMYKTL